MRMFQFVMPLIVVLAVISLSIGQAHEVPHFEVASVPGRER